MFLHLGSDALYMEHAGKNVSLPRFGIEDVLGGYLVDRYRECPFDQIVLFNGPSGFTTLRVGVLAINLFVALLAHEKKSISIWSCDKLHLYSFLVHQGFLPRFGVIYLGQKKGVWLYDFASMTSTSYDKQIVFDTLHEGDFFVDEVAELNYWNGREVRSIAVRGSQSSYEVTYRGKMISVLFSDLCLSSVSVVDAVYGMKAV